MMRDTWRLRSVVYDILEGSDLRRGAAKSRLFARAHGRTLLITAGTGLDFKHLPAIRVIAIDFSTEMLARARRRTYHTTADVTLVAADAMCLPFAAASFDTVITSCSLCSIARPEAALNEVHRVLAPGGTLLLFEHVRSRQPLLACTLDLMTWLTRNSGTAMNRDTLAAVSTSGFHIDSVTSVFLDIILAVEASRAPAVQARPM